MRILGLRPGLVALILLVTMPLRVFAMALMPCCPLVERGAGQHAMHDGSTTAMPDAYGGDGHAHAAPSACCAVALTATGVVPSSPAYVPPHAGLPPVTAIAAITTDPPERPPRPIA